MSRKPLPNRYNAMTHTAYYVGGLLPGEDADAFAELHRDLIAEWNPCGGVEEDAVRTLARLIWRKQRAVRYWQSNAETGHLKNFLETTSEKDLCSAIFLAGQIATKNDDAMIELMLASLPKLFKEDIQSNVPRASYEDSASWARAISNHIKLLADRATMCRLVRKDEEFATPEKFAQELSVQERLEAMIDRAIKRIVHVKTIKQLMGNELGIGKPTAATPKQISSKSATQK